MVSTGLAKNSPRVCRLPLTWSLQAWQKKLSTCLSTSFDVVSTGLAKKLSTCLSTSLDVVSTGLAKKLSTCLSTSFDVVSTGLAKKLSTCLSTSFDVVSTGLAKNSPRVCRLPLTWSLQAWQKTLHVSVDFLYRCLYRLGKKTLHVSVDFPSCGLHRLGKKSPRVCRLPLTWSLQAW